MRSAEQQRYPPMKKTIWRGCSIQTQGKSRRKRAVRRRGTRGNLEDPSPPLSPRGSLSSSPLSPPSNRPLKFITHPTRGFRSMHGAALLMSFPSLHLIHKLLSPLHPNTLVFLFFSSSDFTIICSGHNNTMFLQQWCCPDY